MAAIWRIITFTKSLWPYYAAVSLLSILLALLAQATPLLTGGIVEQLQNSDGGDINKNLLWIFVGALFVQDVVITLTNNLQGYYGDILSAKLREDLSNRYYEHMLALPQSYFDTEVSGKITARLTRSVTEISNFSKLIANSFGTFILQTIFSLAIVAYYSWPVALLLFSLYPIFIYMTIRASGKWINLQEKINTNVDESSGRFLEAIGQVKAVKSFVQERRELKFFGNRMKKIVQTTYPQSIHWHKQDVQRRLILNIIFGLVFGVIIYQAINGDITLAETVILIQFSTLIRFPIFTISFLVENIQRAVSDSKDYFAAMEVEPSIADKSGAKALKVKQGAISFNDVVFGYEDTNVIKGLNFDIEPGSKVALVGESGEGKSTIANLLMRLYDPKSGQIKIDNSDISGVTQSSLRKSIGVVFQEPNLFSGTIAENIAYSNPSASKKQIESAAKAANAHDFITKFDAGYEASIGERGLKLSGGQKQRISIARAILKDAPILILDEATSSLDSKSELLVQEALERLMKDRTTIIIAHRLSTIQNVDQIVTLKNGKVEEIGSPTKLSKTDGIYAQLLQVQSASTPDERKKALQKFGIVA